MFKICRVQFLLCWQLNDIREKNECGYDWLPGTFSVAKYAWQDTYQQTLCS